MSRSYKKVPGFKDRSRNGAVYWKRLANKKVRKYKGGISNGCSFKKISNSWDICDWTYLEYHWPNKRKVKVSLDYKRYIK